MNTHSMTTHISTRMATPVRSDSFLRAANSLPCLALLILASTLPSAALVVVATWASNSPVLLPVAQAAAGLSGFVFLALALDAKPVAAMLNGLTALAVTGLALASLSVSEELVIVAAIVVAARVASGLFHQVRMRCL